MNQGTYTLTVRDANNCNPITTVVTIGANPASSLNAIQSTPVICNGGTGDASVTLSNGSGGTYTYNWSNGQTTPTVTGLQLAIIR